MVFDEMGLEHGKTLLLFPGTCCNYETNFGTVLEELGNHYHLICVNYDGFDGSDQIFPDMINMRNGLGNISTILIFMSLTCSMSNGCLVITAGRSRCWKP